MHRQSKRDSATVLPEIKRKNSPSLSAGSELDGDSNELTSSLNCWYRQQGGNLASLQSKNSSSSKQTGSIKLPRISQDVDSLSFRLSNCRKKTKKKKNRPKNSSGNVADSELYTARVLGKLSSGSGYLNNETSSDDYSNYPFPQTINAPDEKKQQLLQQPRVQTENIFYQKCIEEVAKTNSPEKIVLSEPRELKYVNGLSDLRYTTIGFGKTFGHVWYIEIFKV